MEDKRYTKEEDGLPIPCRVWLPSEQRAQLVSMLTLPPETLTLDVIAHSLATKNRYNGHTPWPYSVALHSVLVSVLLPKQDRRLQLEGLMHDAAEAYVGDVISPIKREIKGQFGPIEHAVDSQIRRFYDLPAVESPEVKEADIEALWLEQHFLQGKPFSAEALKGLSTLRYLAARSVLSAPVKWEVARDMFTHRYDELAEHCHH